MVTVVLAEFVVLNW